MHVLVGVEVEVLPLLLSQQGLELSQIKQSKKCPCLSMDGNVSTVQVYQVYT